MAFFKHDPPRRLARFSSPSGQAVVESALAIPLLIALFAACLQMLHLGLAKVVVYIAAYESARQGTINNMNLNEARRTAEEVCGVLGKGRTEVTYDGQVQRYTITHYLRPIVPVIREIKVSETFPAYVFLPGNELPPANTSNRNQSGGGRGGGSPSREYASRGGSHLDVADYDPAVDGRTGNDSTNTNASQSTAGLGSPSEYARYASLANPYSAYGSTAPLRAPPGSNAPYNTTGDTHIPTDEEIILGISHDSGNDALAWDDEEYNASASAQASADAGASSAPTNKGRASTFSPHEGDSSGLSRNEKEPSSVSPPLTGGTEGEGDVSGTATSSQDKSLLTASAEAAAKAAGKRAGETLAFYQGVAEGYTGDSNADNAFWAGQRWANQKTEESRNRLDQRLGELDAQDQELDKAAGLKKLAGKASVKSKKIGAVARNIIEEGIYDIPKVGQDLPDAWKNTKAAGRAILDGEWKEAAKSGGKAVGLVAQEAGRLSAGPGKLAKALGKGAKAGVAGLKAADKAADAAKAAKKAGKAADAAKVGKKYYRYVNDNEAKKIKETGKIPNTNTKNEIKEVYITDKKYKTSGKAKTHLQLPQKPLYRVEIDSKKIKNKPDLRKIKNSDNPQWGKGGGTEATTKESIEVDTSKIKKLKGAE
ncbi:MAG: TadE family protein [candidate division FCPU426 bacterium]